MARAAESIPDGYHTVTPYLTVPGAARLIDFLKEAFGAVEDPSGNRWWIATYVEDVSPEELQRRTVAAAKG